MTDSLIQPLWQERVREARARAEVLKARQEARSLIHARESEIARAAQEAEEARKRAEETRGREEHDQKLEALKEYGRSLAVQAGLPTDWRARATAEVERYVTRDRFPMTLADHEGRAYVSARVDAIIVQYRANQSEELKQVLRRIELESKQTKVRDLIKLGKERATSETLSWDRRDAEAACRDVARELAEQVRPDSTQADVEDTVDRVLAEWSEDDEDEEMEEEMDEEPDADDDWF